MMRALLGLRATPALLADLVELTKLRLASLVGFTAFVGALLASGPAEGLARSFEAAFWITCSAAAGGVLNQVLERDADALMERTKRRPLVTGRIGVRDAVLLGTLLACAAVAGLALRFNVLSSLLALSALFAYVAVYTPLKRVSSLNTVVGALPGAAPPLIGYVALAGAPGQWGLVLFALVFAWQFPHFMAIAWLYRADYRRAGFVMLPTLPEGEAMAGRQALVYSLVLLPLSLLPGVWGSAGLVYVVAAFVLGLGYCAAALYFARRQTRQSARLLMLTSLAYLPLLLSAILFDPVVPAAVLHVN